MIITYEHQGALYLNITNLCTNKCTFCLREGQKNIYAEDTLWLEREPSREEIIHELQERNLDGYSEIVFCGYGEPTCRLYDMLRICRWLREHTETKIRLNTNGHASLIMGEATAKLFEGLFDTVSISLNAADSDTYMKICRPHFGEQTYMELLKFIREIVRHVPEVVLTAVRGTISDEEIQKCAKMAAELGAKFRARDYIET